MRRITGACLIGVFVVIAWGGNVFAESSRMSRDVSINTVFGIAAIAAILIAFLLVNFAKSERAKGFKTKERNELQAGIGSSTQSFTSAISEQIDSLSGPANQRNKAAGTIMNIFNEELKKKTDTVKVQLSQKYEEIVSEKKQKIVAVQKKYKHIMKEKKQTETVVRSIAEGLVVIDAKGNIALINPAAEKLLGVKKENKIGKPILEDLKDEQLISLVKETSAGDKEVELTSHNSETKRILRSSSAVIEDENGKTVGMVSVLSDVTKQKELEKLKADFISKITHELRTPIAIIQNSLSLMLEDESNSSFTEIQEKFLSIIKRNLGRLQTLISETLDLSKLEQKKMKLKIEPCSMEKIINDVSESLSTWAKTKEIEIEKVVQDGLPEIPMDSFRIIQVLNNIIGNAIKFTPRQGKVTVEAKLRQQDKEIEINVTDNGAGIAEEDLSKVFDKFQQVGERTWTDISGSGLGLSIAKEIVELHHGRIWAASEKGHGAKFTFTLPLTANEQHKQGA